MVPIRMLITVAGHCPPFFDDSLLPMLQVWIYEWVGHVDQSFVKLIGPYFYAAALLLLIGRSDGRSCHAGWRSWRSWCWLLFRRW